MVPTSDKKRDNSVIFLFSDLFKTVNKIHGLLDHSSWQIMFLYLTTHTMMSTNSISPQLLSEKRVKTLLKQVLNNSMIPPSKTTIQVPKTHPQQSLEPINQPLPSSTLKTQKKSKTSDLKSNLSQIKKKSSSLISISSCLNTKN